MQQDPVSFETLRARVAAADRQRRAREIAQRIWRLAPLASGLSLAVAIAGRLAGWPALVTLAVILVSLGSLAVLAVAARRSREISDTDAAAIDGHAGLNGELRSAHWFAGHDERNPWIDYHVARAASRVESIDWNGIYPAPRTPRAKAATAVLALTALIIAVGLPGRASMTSLSGRTQAAATPARNGTTALLPAAMAELFKRLEGVLSTVESGKGRSLSAQEVRGLLAELDKLLAQKDDARPPKDGAKKGSKPISAADLKALAERAKHASQSSELEPEVRDALADMSEKLADEATAQNAADKEKRDATDAEPNPAGESAQAQASGNKQDPGAQSVKEAAGSSGVGVVMMAGDSSSSKEAGLGLGGASGANPNNGQMPDLAAALRKETIESAKDDEGDKNELGERRQTERGTATAAYAHSAPAAAGRGRSTAPPPVPESRKATLRSYFTRKQ